MFTHHVYFYGFISELLHSNGVKSITFGSPDIPLFKPGLKEGKYYSWSMGSDCQNTLKVPTSCYEYSQPKADIIDEYIDFVKKSCERKVPDRLYDSIVAASSYKKLEHFLEKVTSRFGNVAVKYPPPGKIFLIFAYIFIALVIVLLHTNMIILIL